MRVCGLRADCIDLFKRQRHDWAQAPTFFSVIGKKADWWAHSKWSSRLFEAVKFWGFDLSIITAQDLCAVGWKAQISGRFLRRGKRRSLNSCSERHDAAIVMTRFLPITFKPMTKPCLIPFFFLFSQTRDEFYFSNFTVLRRRPKRQKKKGNAQLEYPDHHLTQRILLKSLLSRKSSFISSLWLISPCTKVLDLSLSFFSNQSPLF